MSDKFSYKEKKNSIMNDSNICNDEHRSSMCVVFTTFTIFSYINQSVGNNKSSCN
jgi:hypothetical protein